jgi:hypothetical protein
VDRRIAAEAAADPVERTTPLVTGAPADAARSTSPATGSPPAWRIQLDDGNVIALDLPVLIGRDPVAPLGERAVALPDETRSVSKTHVRVESDGAQVTVTDMHSTNGVAVVINGVPTACEPGRPTPAPAWSTVRFGDREFRLLPDDPGSA